MYRYNFEPFNCSLENVRGSDLLKLKDVAEGWYIDYKREPIPISAFGRHLSAFANQYGGWIFIGVEECRQTQKAMSF